MTSQRGQAQHVFRHGATKRAYADFRAASRQTLNMVTFAHRLRLDIAADPEHVESVAFQMAERGRLTLYLARDGHITEVGLPWSPSA